MRAGGAVISAELAAICAGQVLAFVSKAVVSDRLDRRVPALLLCCGAVARGFSSLATAPATGGAGRVEERVYGGHGWDRGDHHPLERSVFMMNLLASAG